jgi:hypothetical protein
VEAEPGPSNLAISSDNFPDPCLPCALFGEACLLSAPSCEPRLGEVSDERVKTFGAGVSGNRAGGRSGVICGKGELVTEGMRGWGWLLGDRRDCSSIEEGLLCCMVFAGCDGCGCDCWGWGCGWDLMCASFEIAAVFAAARAAASAGGTACVVVVGGGCCAAGDEDTSALNAEEEEEDCSVTETGSLIVTGAS